MEFISDRVKPPNHSSQIYQSGTKNKAIMVKIEETNDELENFE